MLFASIAALIADAISRFNFPYSIFTQVVGRGKANEKYDNVLFKN